MTGVTSIEQAIKTRGAALGLDVVRLTSCKLSTETQERYRRFLGEGHHGTMNWLARTPERRATPQGLWPDVETVIVCGLNYGTADSPLPGLEKSDRGYLSVYARNRDYHDVLKGRLKQFAGWLQSRLDCALKVFVDTAPVLEKPLAARAGIGWQGKHTNLVSRQFGSWLFLGEIFLAKQLIADEPESDHCGQCRRCLDVCPTKAFPAPYQLDARRCISYLTIEHQGQIDLEFREAIGNRIYGCDDCLAVCPWNKFATTTKEAKLQARNDLIEPRLEQLAMLDDAGFRRLFSGTPIKRIGRDRFVRNVLIAIGNSGKASLARPATALLEDPAPFVRGMAVWALHRLLPAASITELRQRYLHSERDPGVIEEWKR